MEKSKSQIEVEEAGPVCDRIIDRVSEVFVGNRLLLRKLLAAALANGHVLFEDYPGLGKTLLAKVFTKVIGSETKRVQFTPDLLPADILGAKVWRQNTGVFELIQGPVFTNVLLADEINRAPPKTQAALLEAMEERQVTIDGDTLPLQPPFLVIATQNPIEQEGTYPLPEAQLDRFLFRLGTGYPTNQEQESSILQRRIQWQKDDPTEDVEPVLDAHSFVGLQRIVERNVYVDQVMIDYITQVVRLTRQHPHVSPGRKSSGGPRSAEGVPEYGVDPRKRLRHTGRRENGGVGSTRSPSDPEHRGNVAGHEARGGDRRSRGASPGPDRAGPQERRLMLSALPARWLALAFLLLALALVFREPNPAGRLGIRASHSPAGHSADTPGGD